MNKKAHWTILVVLSLFSPALLALGLGGAVIESYLDQPLDVRVELISQSNEELQSITVGLASADDFELLGMSRTAITVPLEFELVTDANPPYVHITSDLKINEPVLQVLVEVAWASGRMLREYTLFLDPPTIDSAAPPVVIKPAQVKTPPLKSRAAPVTPIQKTAKPEAEKTVTPEVAAVTPDRSAEQPAETTAAESTSGQDTEQESQRAAEQHAEDEVYGPVARGETLWGIAREYSRGSGYSINQAMLALQRKNPEAFIRGNINSLKRGAILRLPAFNELGELTTREAVLEVVRQEEEVRTRTRSVAPDYNTPTVADSGDYQASVTEEIPEPGLAEDKGHLELVPPAEGENPELQVSEPEPEPAPAPAPAPVQDAASESLQEELSRTEEELVNARQENTYLSERIKELEKEAKAREEQTLAVKDSGLANMESSLAAERAAGQPEPPLAITPGGEKQAWYAGKTPLIGGIAVVLIVLIVWGLRRRSAGLFETQGPTEVQAIADDAENTLRTKDSEASEGKTVVQAKPKPEPEPEPESLPEPDELPQSAFAQGQEGPTVVLQKPALTTEPEAEPVADLDEEVGEDEEHDGDDPEIKLDLARAYLSLGDKEASKSMLDEVIKSGNEAQKAEARQMLEEL